APWRTSNSNPASDDTPASRRCGVSVFHEYRAGYPVEQVIDANPHDVDRIVRFNATESERKFRVVQVPFHIIKLNMQVLGPDAPIAEKPPLETATGRPAEYTSRRGCGHSR